jgi:hypothetical protein
MPAKHGSGLLHAFLFALCNTHLLFAKAWQGSGDKGVESPGIDAALLSGSDTPPAVLVCMETVISLALSTQ